MVFNHISEVHYLYVSPIVVYIFTAGGYRALFKGVRRTLVQSYILLKETIQ